MTELHIQIGAGRSGVQVKRMPVPLEVRELETFEQITRKSVLGETATVRVKPGEWRITAHFPSGNSVHANAHVAMGDRYRQITLQAAETSFDKELGSTHPDEAELFRVDTWDREVICLLDRTDRRMELHFWNARGHARFERVETPSAVKSSKHGDRCAASTFCCLTAATKNASQSLWMTVTTDGKKVDQLIALPPAGELNIAIGKGNHSNGSQPRVVVTGNRIETEALLAYLHHGSTFATRLLGPDVVARHLRDLNGDIKRKDGRHVWRSDVSTAAAVGYFSLRWPTHSTNFERWLESFAASTDWFPDSNVIYASYLMMKTEVNFSKVRGLLIEACERGIPTYTDGLSRLAKNLAYLNEWFEHKDTDLKRAAQKTNEWALLADPSVVTTTIRPRKVNLQYPLPYFEPFAEIRE